MNLARVDLNSCHWEHSSPGMRVKRAALNGKQLRLIEIGPDFGEPDWCEAGHIGYVLEGEMEIHFEGGTERLAAGDGLFIAGGSKHRHKSKAVSDLVRLILVEDV